jgi:integrase/recombinase XerC
VFGTYWHLPLYHLGLRRNEVVTLNLQDLDLKAGIVAVLGKGRREKVQLSLPRPTAEALWAWLAIRGENPGPLFHRLDRAGWGQGRLTGNGLYGIIRRLGEQANVQVRPHQLRHSSITRALDLTNGDVRTVQKFSRHKDIRVLLRYDDNRADLGGSVARRLAEDAGNRQD